MITLFEKFNNDKKYWIIKNDEYADVRLFKIGMSLDIISKVKVITNKKVEKFFIGYNPYNGPQEKNKWSYASYQYSDNHPLYENDYEYMGYVEINKNDIDEYESKITSKKYNL